MKFELNVILLLSNCEMNIWGLCYGHNKVVIVRKATTGGSKRCTLLGVRSTNIKRKKD